MSQHDYRQMRIASWKRSGSVIWGERLYVTSEMPSWMIDILLDLG